jgi:hypothetical protein
MEDRVLKVLMAIAAVAALASPAAAEEGDYFHLYSKMLGRQWALTAIENGGLHNLIRMDPFEDLPGQLWRKESDGDFIKLHIMLYTSVCLDVINGGEFDWFARVQKCGPYSGQHWFAIDDSGWVRFTTGWLGDAACLQVTSHKPYGKLVRMLPCDPGNPAQLWRVHMR